MVGGIGVHLEVLGCVLAKSTAAKAAGCRCSILVIVVVGIVWLVHDSMLEQKLDRHIHPTMLPMRRFPAIVQHVHGVHGVDPDACVISPVFRCLFLPVPSS